MDYYFENRVELREEVVPVSFYERKGFDFFAHWHTDIELAYVVKGSVRVGINQKTYLLEQGEGVVIESGDVHFYQCTDCNAIVKVCVFSPDLVTIHGMRPTHFHTPVFDDNKWNGLVNERLNKIGEELQNKKRGYPMQVKGELLLLTGHFLRSMELEGRETGRQLQNERRKINDILRFIEKNMTDDICLEQVAKEFQIDKFTLSKKLCVATGMNFRSLVNVQRLQKARELLETTELTALDIALECGYNNVRTFNRVFREKTGMTPSDFRNQKGGSI